MPYAMIKGLRLFYKDVGAGRPLVLVPGLGADSTAYNPLLPQLRGRLRVIAPDPRGLGRSDDGPGPLNSEQLAGELASLLENPKRRRELASEGRKSVATMASATRMAEETLAVYRTVAGASRS